MADGEDAAAVGSARVALVGSTDNAVLQLREAGEVTLFSLLAEVPTDYTWAYVVSSFIGGGALREVWSYFVLRERREARNESKLWGIVYQLRDELNELKAEVRQLREEKSSLLMENETLKRDLAECQERNQHT